MEIQSNTISDTSEDSLFKKLLERRVPQILLFYIGSVWTIFGIVSWCVNRYVLSPHLEELFLMTGLLFLPAVLLIAYGHGAKGKEPWLKYEKVGLLCNVVIAGAVLFLMFNGKDLGSAQKTVQVVDSEGNEVERVIPKDAFRKRIALFHFDNSSNNADLDWLQTAIPNAWEADLAQDLFLTVQKPDHFADKIQKAGFQDGFNVPSALKRNVTTEYNLSYFVSGTFTKENEEYVITTALFDAESGKEMASTEYRGGDLFQLIDQMTVDLKKDLDLPSKHIEDTVDLPVSDVLTSSETALKAYSDGLFQVGFSRDFTAALASYTAATTEDPTFALAHVHKYVTEFQQGMVQPAIQTLGMAQQHSYRLTEQMQYLIKVAQLNLSGNQEQALEAAIQWATLFPDDLLAHQICGMLHILRTEFDEAIATYQKMLEIDPYQEEVSLQIGQLLNEAGKTDEAIEQLEAHIEQYPDKNGGHKALAQIYFELGDLEKELEARKKALSLAPNDPVAILSLGETLRRQGDFDGALSRFEAAIANSKTPQEQINSYMNFGEYYSYRGEHQHAITQYEKALDIASSNLPVLLHLFYQMIVVPEYYRAGQKDKARSIVENAINNPAVQQIADIAVYTARAASYVYVRDNNPDESLSALEKAEVTMNANNMNLVRPVILYARGDVFKQTGQFDQALEMYESYLETASTSSSGWIRQGEVFYAMDQLDKAEDSFEKALSFAPSSPTANLGMGKVAIARNNTEEASAYLEKALLTWENADETNQLAQEARELLASL